VAPPSKGTPTTAASYFPTSRMFSTNGALRKVLMPAKCGFSPREKVGIERSSRLSAPGRPMSRAHFISRFQPSLESFPSACSAFQPWVSSLL
jgi:hypothetical protein